MMNQKQQLVRNPPVVTFAIPANGVIEVPGELLLENTDLIDSLLALAYDVLGWRNLEIRIRPQAIHRTHIRQEEIRCQPN